MPGLVDCHIHPAQYVDTGTEPLPYFDFVLNTLIPTEVAFRNMTLAREVSMELVVSKFYITVFHVYISLANHTFLTVLLTVMRYKFIHQMP